MGTAREELSKLVAERIAAQLGEISYCLPTVHPLPLGTWMLDDHLDPHKAMQIVSRRPHTQANAQWWYEVRYADGQKGGCVEWRHPWVRLNKSAVREWLSGKVNTAGRVVVTMPGLREPVS
jgi:hypothetical protein